MERKETAEMRNAFEDEEFGLDERKLFDGPGDESALELRDK